MQEKIPLEEVFETLQCTKDGLSSDEGLKRLQTFGPNKLEEKKACIVLLPTLKSKYVLDACQKNIGNQSIMYSGDHLIYENHACNRKASS